MNASSTTQISRSTLPALSRPWTGRRKIRCRPRRVSALGNWAHDRGYGGGSVDESMIVLRMRIHEMKIAERNYEPPAEWTGWEKRYYTSYDSDVCHALGLLQTMLMNTRPGVALAMLLLVTLSVPTSLFAVLFRLVELTNGALSGFHLH
ncbi:hypothetical protein H6P81_008945 [Aristolochia fimbriata]|uniref:Uncharacterized protein n=1 Tax=Aristolochia fimbriata TaxID=158543 RepID=A0AAV7EJE1_ARIFI|nr:hypothetical protein H6P81_008945 [Aristolochia fimbriata]